MDGHCWCATTNVTCSSLQIRYVSWQDFQDVVIQYPEHYFHLKRKKGTLPAETKDFVQWVDIHFEADGKVLNWRTVTAPAQASSSKDRSKCTHQNVHHKGSSAAYK
eukprot:4160677-Karenia_brevis.AAC.1